MLDSGIERDSLHYNISEDEGYGCPIMCILSPREPGKTTSIMLDRVYADFRKKGLPTVALVNQAADCTEPFMQSFENTINEFKGYEVHTTYRKGGIKDGICTIYERDTKKPFIHVISLNTPLTRLKRINLGKVGCMWYDECMVNVMLGEKWPTGIATKWNELYTTLARKSYPDTLKFYMSGNFYSRYSPLLTYLGVDCSKMSIGKKFVTRNSKVIDIDGKQVTVDTSVLVDCLNLKPELREYILQHNPGYVFDDTYQKYFEGVAIADMGLPIQEQRPEGYRLGYVFRVGQSYLWIWKSTEYVGDDKCRFWLEVKKEPPGSRRDVFVVNLDDMMNNTMLAKSFSGTFEILRFFIGRGAVSFQSPEAFYMMQQIYTSL